MGKIKEFFSNLFSMSNLLTGMVGIGFGIGIYVLNKFIMRYTFQDIAIFIGTGIMFLLVMYLLGFLLNKTLLKDDD
jgi:hypothetical protein